MADPIRIPIAKAGKGVYFEVDPDMVNELGAEAFARIIEEGLKVLLNSKMSTLPAPSKLDGAEAEKAKEAALAKAAANLSELKAGKLTKKAGASKATGVDRAVVTEANRLAKEFVKDQIRKAGLKISHYAAKDITAAAKLEVERDSSYLEQAKANIVDRAKVKSTIDIASIIAADPKLVAKAAKEAAERKAERQLSAKQAGRPQKHTAKVPPRRGDQPHAVN